ncbi:MAG: pyridoxal-phosphate dependent enzyme [Chitinophagaceae bacterium]|nr:MAG: pyridoxal-phosphate dependent enzyme [Chitinophagaceae bacterium]
MSFSIQNCSVQSLQSATGLPIDVLRLDLIHPVVSGNKWFKLKEYLRVAKAENKTTLLTFGGAFSNHIVASAAAAKMEGFNSIGIIRGEEPRTWSPTLLAAKTYGMSLIFESRTAYREKQVPPPVYQQYAPSEIFEIPEGGYGLLGKQGAMSILHCIDTSSYTHIVCAVGTGTTLAGLVEVAKENQKIVGIPVLKNAFSLQNEIANLLSPEKQNRFELITDYHFGGYAKRTSELIAFMNSFYRDTEIPTDFVYTGKTMFAVFDLFRKGFFTLSDKILFIHTGGLQGNLSLQKGTLIFG